MQPLKTVVHSFHHGKIRLNEKLAHTFDNNITSTIYLHKHRQKFQNGALTINLEPKSLTYPKPGLSTSKQNSMLQNQIQSIKMDSIKPNKTDKNSIN